MTARHQGRVVLITGGGNGIGAATAAAIVREGGSVVLGDIVLDAADARAAELGAAALAVHLDVADAASWDSYVAEAVKRYGRIDGLVNNAGIATGHGLLDTDGAEMTRILAVNTVGPFLGIKAALPHLRESGSGSIVNISSCAGLAGLRSNVAYSTSKYAIRGLTKTLVHELGVMGVRINSVFPGYVDTPLSRPDWDNQAAAGQQPANVALGRTGHPRELAEVVAFLLSDEASYCTGSEFVADGGLMSVVPPRELG
ncbi:SDR family NAD(P)-dependent oxidoreductase [Longivirga aurantiaca]|uniref:SDR family NAD(P)-dependent oxidoreductase n=1 Tax=Longivirga aurantiaca TaxID=1837743 RepID=A0ABW1T3H0_9ACTN